jgi:hypothetical protein
MNSLVSPLKPECARGWFAAGKMLEPALGELSDGAFKLFLYLCLQTPRQTGSLRFQQASLAARLGKSRRSIGSYLQELTQKGYCSIQACRNQYGAGILILAEAYWPYQRTLPAGSLDSPAAFVEQVKQLFLTLVPETVSFSNSDHQLACRWHSQKVSLEIVERALLLGAVRKLFTRASKPADPPIRSLHYFQPLLEEVQQIQVKDSYWDYLRLKLQKLGNPSPPPLPTPPRQRNPGNSSASQEVVR